LPPVLIGAGCGNVNRMSEKLVTADSLGFLFRMSAVVTGDYQFIIIIIIIIIIINHLNQQLV
jgi:hypothetical protein